MQTDPVQDLQVLVVGNLRITITTLPTAGLRVDWTGRSDEREPGRTVAPFLGAVISRARDHGWPIEMHFEKLEHFNSSTITALIQLIRTAREKQVRLALHFNGTAKWQQLSFDALGIFEQSDGLVRFQAVG